MKLLGINPATVKWSSKDTGGGVCVFEHKDMGKGGPGRHLHYEQDEWFYVVKGEFKFEIGDDAFVLHAGDSIIAPRLVPHVWAHTDDTPGTMIVALQPAGRFEEFLRHIASFPAPLSPEENVKIAAEYGMKSVGPPLKID